MHVGCCLEMFGDAPLDDALNAIRQVGLHEVEWPLWAAASGTAATTSPAAPFAGHAATLSASTLRAAVVRSVGSNALPDEGQVKAFCATASELNASVLVVPAGQANDDQTRTERIARIRRLGAAAAARGLQLALETSPGLCGHAREMQRLMLELDDERVGLCFDTGGYLVENVGANIEIAAQRVLPWITCLRLRDHNDFDSEMYFPPFGIGGGVDFARLRQLLEAINFRGPCMISCTPKQRRPATIEDRRRWLEECLEHLDECGWPLPGEDW